MASAGSMKAMKSPSIAIDARMLHASGIGTYLRSLLPRIIARAPDVTFHLLGHRDEIASYPWACTCNVSVTHCSSPIYSAGEQLELVRKVPAEAAVVWSPHYNLPVLARKRLVVTVHDVFHLAMAEQVKGVHKRLYARLLFAAVAARARRTICVSDFTARELEKYTGLSRDRIEVIHNGVESAWFGVDRSIPPAGRPYFLFVGNVKPHKNLARLVEAFSCVAARVPHDLVIVGKKEGFITGDEVVAGMAARLGERVRFTGYVDDAALRGYYAAADSLVFPSLYEGFGLPPLEAMACGCPVLSSQAASLPEICGDAALYCDPYSVEEMAERLVQMAEDRVLRESLKERGVARASTFTWDSAAARTLAVLLEALHH